MRNHRERNENKTKDDSAPKYKYLSFKCTKFKNTYTSLENAIKSLNIFQSKQISNNVVKIKNFR